MKTVYLGTSIGKKWIKKVGLKMIRDNDFAGKNHRGMHPCRQGNSWNCSYDNLKKKKAH